MRVSDANIIAIRQGIAAHLIILGFKRKSERLYELQEKGLYFWVSFTFSDDSSFIDSAGVVSKSLNDRFDASPLEFRSYNEDAPRNGHVWFSAIREAVFVSDKNWERYYSDFRWLGPIRWLLPLRKRWEWQDWLKQCPHIRADSWYAGSDPGGCAAVSLKKWRETVEPWLDAMRDRKQFAGWYHHPYWSYFRQLHRAVCWVWAGDLKKAKELLQSEYNRSNNWTYDVAHRALSPGRFEQNRYKTDEDFCSSVNESVHQATLDVEEVRSLVEFLGVALDDKLSCRTSLV